MPTVCWLLYILVVGLSNGVAACANTAVKTQDRAIYSGLVDGAVDEPSVKTQDRAIYSGLVDGAVDEPSDDEEPDIEFPKAGTDFMEIKWRAPDEPQGKIWSYQVTATNEKTGNQVEKETMSNGIKLTHLSPFTRYNISVKTEGRIVVTRKARTLPLAGQKVQDVGFSSIGTDSISVYWSPPEEPYGEIWAYYVEATDMATQNMQGIQVYFTKATIDKLTPNTKYNISVRSVNEKDPFFQLGGGAGEAVFNVVQTLPAVGQPVSDMQFSHIGNDTFTVKWSAPNEPQGEIQSYHVKATNTATGQQLKEETTSKEATFKNLSPFTYYSVSVRTENKQLNGKGGGIGEAFTKVAQTQPIMVA